MCYGGSAYGRSSDWRSIELCQKHTKQGAFDRRSLGTPSGWPRTSSFRREHRAEQRRRAERGLCAPDPRHGFYMREARMSLDHPVVSWQDEERFEMGKRFGIHFLHPFLDPDVVDLCFRSLPSRMSEGGRTKGLVRGTIARRFPSLGLDRQRKVISIPFYHSLLLREWAALANVAGDFPALS